MRKMIFASLALLSFGCSALDDSASSSSEARNIGSVNTAGTLASGVEVLSLTGDLHTHDPSLIRQGTGDWFVFSTGDPAVGAGNVQIRRSSDMLNWTYAGTVFDTIPAWVTSAIPGVTNIWAPEVYQHAGTYYLYYAASSFGSNRSVIGLATNTTLDPSDPSYAWVDRGLVTESFQNNDYNAIDPAVIDDGSGTPWLAFGSFWSGVRMLRMSWADGKVVLGQGEPLRLVDRFVPPNAVEAPALTYHWGYYYLFVSFDFCCQGTNSTYKIAVGRSRTVNGPYNDRLGTPLAHGGGTVILSQAGTMFGPGGESVYGGYLAHHFYDGNANGDFRLGIRRIAWDYDGWPRVATPSQF